MEISALQQLVKDGYFETDHARGIYHTALWFHEEVGELSSAIASGDKEIETHGQTAQSHQTVTANFSLPAIILKHQYLSNIFYGNFRTAATGKRQVF